MMIQAVLGNPSHPEYGVATIPFPIPHDQYAHCMELLEALEIGDAVKADCQVQEINSFYFVLKRTEKLTVNVEELNYLAKRLDSFDMGEATQFQAMAHKLELSELKDLINLTFCCQQTTVITDFSDLAAVGRDHYMNLHGGCTTVTELEALDGEETARQLIASVGGTVTPYGVVYDNGMRLEQVYDGQFFPCYYYEPHATMVAVTPKSEPENTEHITWLYLPMAQEEIDRVLQRSGIADSEDARLRLEHSQLPDEVNALLDMEHESLADLNALAQATNNFSTDDIKKLGAAVTLAKPQNAEQVKNLAENLDLFDFAPDAHSPAEYGKYMIQQSGHYEFDENLDEFYDYEGYAQQRINDEDGMFGLHPDLDADQTVTLTLPASAEELKKAQKQLDADGWEGVVVLAYDGIIPQAAEFADLPAELETFNHFAEVVENMPSREKQLPKFKAVLRICQCSSVNQAISLAERLEHFYFDAKIKNYADLVYDELENVIGGRQAEELRQCLDIEKYGRILQQGYNAVFTEYGMVTRDDFQPMDAPWQDESEVMDIQIT